MFVQVFPGCRIHAQRLASQNSAWACAQSDHGQEDGMEPPDVR